ncbi:MAG: pitrilysin family protein [archaeon]
MEFKKKVLANGMTVLFEKRDVPVTTVMLATKYGSAYESEKEKGMAHFMEHLCFKGTEKRSVDDISSEVESVGGDLNAFTHEEVTAYHVKLPSKHLEIAMDVIFDVFFNPTFPEAEIEKEGNVIVEEIKMYRDNPQAHVFERIKEGLYEKPFGMFGAGTIENVKSFSREKLFNRHREVYCPSNAILSVVGNNDFEDVIKMAEKFSVERDFDGREFPEVVFRSGKGEEKRAELQQTNLTLGFHFPNLSSSERYAAEVFTTILGSGMSSKLFREVRERKGLVYGVKSVLDLGKNYGYMVIWAGTDPEKKEEVIKICLEEFKKMGSISEEELEKAKIQVIGGRHVESESSDVVAVSLILEEVSGDAKDYYDYEKKINSVTLDDIKELAKISEFASFSLGP